MNASLTALPVALVIALLCTGCAQSQSAATAAETQSAATASEPPLAKMAVARVSGKLSVPVDVRYFASSEPALDRQMMLQLAFTPRVEGQNLKIEYPASESTSIDSGGGVLTQQKATTDDTIRRTLLVTPRKAGAAEVRVLVSMDVGGGRYFGVFSIPVVVR